MNAAIVSRTLSLIPERVVRVQSGSTFDPGAETSCAHPDRIAHLAQFLNWLGPLRPLTKEDLRLFGLMTAYGKPAIQSAIGEDIDIDAELDAEEELEPEELELAAPGAVPAALQPEPETEPALP